MWSAALDVLLPPRCVLCGCTGTGLCHRCAASLPAAPELAPPPGYDACASLLSYEGSARDLVAAVKFHGRRDAVGLLGGALAELVAPLAADMPGAAVTWAPTTRARAHRRGADQAEVLATATARALGRRSCATLVRRDRGSQTGADREQRLAAGPRFATRGRVAGAWIVVDDVRTTGATLCAAGDALLAAGATSLVALTLAVRP